MMDPWIHGAMLGILLVVLSYYISNSFCPLVCGGVHANGRKEVGKADKVITSIIIHIGVERPLVTKQCEFVKPLRQTIYVNNFINRERGVSFSVLCNIVLPYNNYSIIWRAFFLSLVE